MLDQLNNLCCCFEVEQSFVYGVFKALQKLLKCFSGIGTFAFVNESLSCGVLSTILVLYLKDSELVERGLLGSSL